MLTDLDLKRLLDFDNEQDFDESKYKKIQALFENPESS